MADNIFCYLLTAGLMEECVTPPLSGTQSTCAISNLYKIQTCPPCCSCFHSDSVKHSVTVLYKTEFCHWNVICWHFKTWLECPYQGVIMSDFFFNKHSTVLRWWLMIITGLPHALISLEWLLCGHCATRCHCSTWYLHRAYHCSWWNCRIIWQY